MTIGFGLGMFGYSMVCLLIGLTIVFIYESLFVYLIIFLWSVDIITLSKYFDCLLDKIVQ